jgi:serine protease Do
VVKYIRNGKVNTAKVLIKELSAEAQSSTTFENLLKGISVQDITPDIRRDLNLPPRVTGVVITNVRDDSPAGEVLSRGDIIVEVNKKKINNVRDYDSMRSRIKSDQRLLILIYRNGSTMYITL